MTDGSADIKIEAAEPCLACEAVKPSKKEGQRRPAFLFIELI